ncbi:hypothetical protein [Bradyrhizobium sp.]|uniref:hypothetical protein n=1 Tax=Bradyrhizobium sp. TaxID=376 RepID=UPI001D673075|nr:hypothetical protein [Bradyrhizobium sp.]MBI5319933.1 hypothetical protein [Bradyrhizobium sp.]
MRLAGYAARREAVSTVLDPIEVSAVLLEAGGRRCLIFSFDLMIVGTELQQAIHARLAPHGFAPAEIMLLASHTHFAPATDRACAPLGVPDGQFVADLVAASENLVGRMLQDQPAESRVEIKRGRLSHSVNRRRYWPLPTVGRTYGFKLTSTVMAPDPQGPTDEMATVLLLRRVDDDRVITAVWHYTCHATAVIPLNVISADFPGAVRRALRRRFGEIPCVFVQGFCGDIGPRIAGTGTQESLAGRLRRFARKVVSGPAFPPRVAGDWVRWSEGLAAGVAAIAGQPAESADIPATLSTGAAQIPLAEFFRGSAPDKPLTVQALRLGQAFELVALSAEVTVEWEAILDSALPASEARLRLYAGYLGALYGYLPTPGQIGEGGYEVTGFQPLFGLSGNFDAGKIATAVVGCAKRAIDDL